MKLDALDSALIAELDADARQSFVELGRKLRTPQETVRYRYSSLIERGAISGFFTVINPGKLESEVHKVLLRFHNVNENKVEEIIEHLVNHPSVNWVARFDGLFDVGFTIWVRRIVELSDFADLLRSKYHRYINRIAFAVNMEAEFLARSPGSRSKRNRTQQASYTSPSTAHSVDRTDLIILRELSVDPRRPATNIAANAGIASETVHARIRRLEQFGVITGYRIVLNSAAVGEMNYYLIVYLRSASTKRMKQFVSYCLEHPCISYVIKALGEWDYELNVEVRDIEEYRALLMELTSEFSDIIREYYGMFVSRIHKFSIMPAGLDLSALGKR